MTEQEKQILELKAKCFDLTELAANTQVEAAAWKDQTMIVLNLLSQVTGIPLGEGDTVNSYLEKVRAATAPITMEDTDA